MRKLIKNFQHLPILGFIHRTLQIKNTNFGIERKINFETDSEMTVVKSRQHFIHMRMPKTFQNLLKLGIQEDYSMGWANVNGFRAGTCTPYYFYDLSRDKETNLMIFPFQAMDATFKTYLKQSPAEAEKKIIELREKVKKVNGTFIVIWHNDSFSPTSEGKEWRKVFENLLKSES